MSIDRIVRAVAEMEMPTEGPNDDRYCPFCGWAQPSGSPELHDPDCPVELARRVLKASAPHPKVRR